MLPRDRSSVRSGGVASGVVSIACDHSPALFLTEIRHAAFNDFLFPFVQERPANSASAEVSHVLIAAEAIDRFLDDAVVAAKHRAVARQKEFGIVLADALERADEVGDVGAMMGVDHADAA